MYIIFKKIKHHWLIISNYTRLFQRYFDWSINGTKLVLTYVDKDGTEGFPGDVTTTVTYELTSKDGLMIDYQATTTKPTPIDLSNHFLFNLAGHVSNFNP